MSKEDLCEFRAKLEAAYLRRLVKSWVRNPESFSLMYKTAGGYNGLKEEGMPA